MPRTLVRCTMRARYMNQGVVLAVAVSTALLCGVLSCFHNSKTSEPSEVARCLRATLSGHQSLIAAIAFSPDGRHLASASADGTVKVWNTSTGEQLRTLQAHA